LLQELHGVEVMLFLFLASNESFSHNKAASKSFVTQNLKSAEAVAIQRRTGFCVLVGE